MGTGTGINMKFDIDKETMARIITEMIVADIMSTYPTSRAENTQTTTEKRMAWIEMDEDEVDKAFEKGISTREYE